MKTFPAVLSLTDNPIVSFHFTVEFSLSVLLKNVIPPLKELIAAFRIHQRSGCWFWLLRKILTVDSRNCLREIFLTEQSWRVSREKGGGGRGEGKHYPISCLLEWSFWWMRGCLNAKWMECTQLLGNDWLCNFWVSIKGYGGEMLSPSSGSDNIYINPGKAHVMTWRHPPVLLKPLSSLWFPSCLCFSSQSSPTDSKRIALASQEIYYRQQPQKPLFDVDVGNFD